LGVLHDRVTGTRGHLLAPGRHEGELAVFLGHHDEAHIRAARPIGAPAVLARGSGGPFVSADEFRAGHEELLVSAFRTAIANHHVACFGRWALRFLAFPFEDCDDNFARLGLSRIDGFRLPRQTLAADAARLLKERVDVDRSLGERHLPGQQQRGKSCTYDTAHCHEHEPSAIDGEFLGHSNKPGRKFAI
jgi:hypothetical protein